jgi:peptidoglycan pentaglycine glycine transferase (the first glycine)
MPQTPSHPPQQSFLQSDIWAVFRESMGWRAHKVNDLLVLERQLPMGKSFLYSPEVSGNPSLLLELIPGIHDIAKRRNSIFYRLELMIDHSNEAAETWRAAFVYSGFIKSFESVQPDDRQIITLYNDDNRQLAEMKPKGRYNIKVAEKAGVRVREGTHKTAAADVDIFYTLFEHTAKRDKFAIRPKHYFQELADTLYRHNCGKIFVASYNDQPLAAAIITSYQGIASYLYGASSSSHRAVMAPYAMHWAVMQWAASLGDTHYDLLAIRPETTKKHPYDGITAFKQRFGGEPVHLLGSWDLVLAPIWYNLFELLEKIRR